MKTQIQISTDLRDYLSEQGNKGESYDEVIKRLIKFKNENKKNN